MSITKTKLDANEGCHFPQIVLMPNLYVQHYEKNSTFGTSAVLVFSKGSIV